MKYKIGQRVEIINAPVAIFNLRHRTIPVYGYITNIDGEYHDVRPTWCKWVVELYRSEIAPCGDVYV